MYLCLIGGLAYAKKLFVSLSFHLFRSIVIVSGVVFSFPCFSDYYYFLFKKALLFINTTYNSFFGSKFVDDSIKRDSKRVS